MSLPLKTLGSTQTRTTNARVRKHKPKTAARVVLDLAPPPIPSWCWRDDWRIGGESSYCLFGLLQALNVITNKRLVQEFFEPLARAGRGVVKNHQVDLRSAESVRLSRLAGAVRMPPHDVVQAFVKEAFPNGGERSHSVLRWCPACVKVGYHTNGFQLPIVQACPAHGDALTDRCPRCNSNIPYRLEPNSNAPLFCCAHCKLDLIPTLRSGWRKNSLSPPLLARMREHLKLLQFCDQLPVLAAEFLHLSKTSRDQFIVGQPAAEECADAYSSFVTQVLSSLGPSQQVDWNHANDTCRYREGSPARCHGGMAASSSSGWPRHILPLNDSRLVQAAIIYRCVRRRLWRREVRQHRRCIVSACRHLWWSLRGNPTSPLCPTATAFIRWRMQWESVSVATMLLDRPKIAPLGLVNWLAVAAPLGSSTWTSRVDDWLMAEVLGCDLLAHFFYNLREEISREAATTICWDPSPAHALSHTCWVCVGRGTVSSPARLFVRPPTNARPPCQEKFSAEHFRHHVTALAQIKH